MSIAQRYPFLALACIAYSGMLTGILLYMGFIQSHVPASLHHIVYYGWYLLILVWPLWSVPLWKYGSKKAWTVILPMGLGLLTMIPVLFYIWVALCWPL